MHRTLITPALALAALALSCSRGGLAPWPCADQPCSGHGVCGVTLDGDALCSCDTGFRNRGPLTCEPDPYSAVLPPVDAAVLDGPAADTRDAAAPDATEDTGPPDAALPEGVLFQDDFENGELGGRYQPGEGEWSIADGQLTQNAVCTTQAPDIMVAGDPAWGDVRVEVDVLVTEVCATELQQAGPIVRVNGVDQCGGNAYYLCVMDVDDGFIAMGDLRGACETGGVGLVDVSGLESGQWYHMSLTAMGATVTCAISGGALAAPVTTAWTDISAAPLLTGAAGLVTNGATAIFDNFRVVEIEPGGG